MENKVYEEVKATLGYDIPLKDDTYAKDKASVYLSFTIGGEKLDNKKYTKIVNDTVDKLTEQAEKVLLKKGADMIDKLVDEKVEAVRKEYEDKLAKAREYVKKTLKSK